MEGLLILAKYGSGRPEKEKNQVSVQLFYLHLTIFLIFLVG
jgi:hypothetical protein